MMTCLEKRYNIIEKNNYEEENNPLQEQLEETIEETANEQLNRLDTSIT